METLKYKVITSARQYNSYCAILETLVFSPSKTKELKDEIALLTLLIETWDAQHSALYKMDPVQLLKSLMVDHGYKAKDLAAELGVSPGLVSDILNYKKAFSKEVIRQLSELFKLSQDAFNRQYELANASQKNEAA